MVVVEESLDMLHGLFTSFRVARSVGKEQSVEVERVEVMVPRHAHYFDATLEQAADDVRLYAAIDQHHAMSFLAERLIGDDLFATHLRHPVDAAVVFL